LLNAELTEHLEKFFLWLQRYGETSYDFQTVYAGAIGKRAKSLYYSRPKLGVLAVAPMVLVESFLPWARVFFWKKQRFPIADAHYAMGFAYLYRATGRQIFHEQAVHFLDVLISTRAPGYQNYCWGYPFDWVTRNGTVPANTPLITTTPYAYEAFDSVYRIDHNERWRAIMRSIAEHAAHDIKDFRISEDCSTCTYFPNGEEKGVVNASAYRSFLLTKASLEFESEHYWQIGQKNLNFVLQAQNQDGSWYYAMDGVRNFIDHIHTCFVLKALTKIDELKNHEGCKEAIKRGVDFYVDKLFDVEGLPRPFAKAPRRVIYKKELYDYAECVNLAVLLRNKNRKLGDRLDPVLRNVCRSWMRMDGSFFTRKLHLGWDRVPMHRWGQSQMFRSLCLALLNGIAAEK
jgi:hypothetical protein